MVILGGAGMLGTELATAFGGPDGCAAATVALGRAECDVTSALSLRAAFVEHRPDVVVNAAAVTDVDAAEADEATAYAVNADGVANVVAAADAVGARVVQISTDYVFDGAKGRPYVEDDTPNPLSVYGASKLAGERAVRSGDTVVRTSWLLGLRGRNVLTAALAAAEEGLPSAHVTDQVGHPSFAADVARVVAQVVEYEGEGVFHATNSGPASRYEVAREAVRVCGGDTSLVRPITADEIDPPRAAVRPSYSVLANRVLARADYDLAPDWRESLWTCLAGRERAAA
ncbi:MAG TPA: dTDP-4-dehydrorhamnose reductase [Acidimicrobiaceae bacterium]|nr:dTDP-4-dehydrorhamnose reductase [Acidimicrobiaceae bacterium]HCB36793.1 dTDP-4-dehydrorhamnose reductase [Acidimicrobiaceae bacterium]